MSKGWTEGLFGCTNDITSCLITWCLPGGLCFIQAKAVDKATQQGMFVPYCLVCCLGVLGGALNRETIRNKLGSFLFNELTIELCIYLKFYNFIYLFIDL